MSRSDMLDCFHGSSHAKNLNSKKKYNSKGATSSTRKLKGGLMDKLVNTIMSQRVV